MEKIEETLNQRSSIYGDFGDATEARSTIMESLNSLHLRHTGKNLEYFDFIAILDIVNKLTRLAATPNHCDSWHDISGYASLIEIHHTKSEKDAD